MRKILSVLLSFFAVIIFVSPVSADTTSTLLPISDGSYTQFSPNSGSVHYTRVDESLCNGNTDFNRETTTGQRDSYGVSLSSIPNGSQITQITLTPCASKNTNGGQNTTMNVFYRLNGVNSSDAGGYTLTTTTPSDLTSTSFSSLSTVKTSSTTLESGAVFTAGNRGLKLSRLATVVTYTILASPSALSANAVSGSQIDLSWTDNTTFEDGFKIERSPNGTSGWNEVGTNSANDTTYSDSGLSAGTTYYYRVYAYNTGGNSSNSNTANATTLAPPTAPTSLTVIPTSTSTANLSWTDNATNETGYRVERSDNGVSGWAQRNGDLAANSTSFTDTGMTYGQTYYYRVYAFNTGGNSGYSNTASVNALIPVAPSTVILTTEGCGGSPSLRTLSWTDNAFNETGFHLERSTDDGGIPGTNFEFVATLSANLTSYEDTSDECGYRIRSINQFGSSSWSYVDIIN